VTDGLSHVVKLYAEDAVQGQEWPNVTPHVISLTVTNSAPTMSGDCGAANTLGYGGTKCLTFSATDPNTGDTETWDAVIDPTPDGAFTTGMNGDLFEICFTPTILDTGKVFTATVTVHDCADAYAEGTCEATFNVIAEEPFGVYIELEDDNNDMLELGAKSDEWGMYEMLGPGVYQGQHQYVSVILGEGSEELHGFDFMIAYDNSALAFAGAFGNPVIFDIPGDYEWEYFTYRFVDNCGGSCPSGLLEVIGIADQNDGFHSPVEGTIPGRIKIMDKPIELFALDFLVSNDYTLECQFVPISFFWTNCTDNSLAFTYQSGSIFDVKQAISDSVFAFTGTGYVDIQDLDGTLPTYEGLPNDVCPSHSDPKDEPIRFIKFYNGGIKIICLEDYDDRGDINLNGIAYEIADAVTFTNYFIYGMAAFTLGDGQGQIAATDVNADGVVLSVADLVYLIRVIVGDILIVPDKLSPNAVPANFGHSGEVVTCDVELGAALFVFEGDVDVTLAQDAAHMDLKTGVVNGNTQALVYSFEKGATFSGNILNTEGKLIAVEAADYNGAAYRTVNLLPTSFTVKNFPNPFNAATTIEMALPVATNWTLTIYNVAGQRVEEFSGYSEAGMNNVIWDASAAASGIYFYKVTTDQGSLTKKMVLLK
jgi:hypothetical protein